MALEIELVCLLALWSPPRCRSTAFWRMIAERGDFAIFHEPFYHLADRGWVDVAGRIVCTETELIAALSAIAEIRPVFCKETTVYVYPAVQADKSFLRHTRHTFLIRDPREAIPSHYALNPCVTLAEIGFAQLHALYTAVVATGSEPVVVDADDLVTRPEAVARAWCARVGIDYRFWPPIWTTTCLITRTCGNGDCASDHGSTSENTSAGRPPLLRVVEPLKRGDEVWLSCTLRTAAASL